MSSLAGAPVLCWLGFQGIKNQNHVCLLQERNGHIELLVPFRGELDEVSCWFVTSDNGFTLLNEKSRDVAYPVPLWVKGVEDGVTYCLVGCRYAGQHANMGMVQGFGRIAASYVVKGRPGVDYSTVDEVKTSMPELASWTGLGSMEEKFVPKENGQPGVQKYSVGFEAQPEVTVLGGDLSAALVPEASGAVSEKEGIHAIVAQWVSLKTTSSNGPRDYRDHMTLHTALRRLLCIFAWRDISFKTVKVKRKDGLSHDIAGQNIPASFEEVVTCEYHAWKPRDGRDQFFVYYSEVGAQGVERWLRLREEFSPGLDEFSHLAENHTGLTLESQMLTYGVAMSEIGYRIEELSGVKSSWRIASNVKTIANDMIATFGYCPFGDVDALAEDISCACNSIKHPDYRRKHPERADILQPQGLFEITEACKILLRTWLAEKLGCSVEVLRSRQGDDGFYGRLCERWRSPQLL
jgi:hypothetical protein